MQRQVEASPVNGKDENPLPPSGEEWIQAFGDEEQYSSLPEDYYQNCPHHFEYVSGIEVQCTNCPWGLYVGQEDTVVDGHLFHQGKQII
jgi:hypothetical protein